MNYRKVWLILLIVFTSVGASGQAVSPEKQAFDAAIDKLTQEGATEQECQQAVATIQRLAAKGFGEALNEVGTYYAQGNKPGITQNYAKALQYFTRAWNAKETQAAKNIAILYYNGYGVPKDSVKAYEWTLKGANVGHLECMRDMGTYCLEPQLGMRVDSISALGWFRKAAEKGDGPSMWQLGRFYYNKGNPEEARFWIKKGAEIDNMQCLHGLGLLYKHGECGMEKNPSAAADYFRKCADMYGHLESEIEYADWLLKDANRGKDAIEYYTRAACKGSIYAMANLGDIYAGCYDVPADEAKAYEWYTGTWESEIKSPPEYKAYLYACAKAALALYLGRGVKMDRAEGRRLLFDLADRRDSPDAKRYIQELNLR